MYFRNYKPRKTLLNKSYKRPLSRDPSTSNMLSGAKHCRNLNGTNFTIFIDYCESN